MPLVNHQSWDQNGNLLIDEWIEVPYPSLQGHQIIATLNAVLGIWSLEDAANAAGVEPDHLVAEAQAWGYVLDMTNA